MKKILKITFVALLGLFSNIQGFAQSVDTGFSNPSLLPLPTAYPGKATFSFDISATLGDQPFSSDDLASDYAEISVTLSKLDGAGIMPTGPGADLFNWTYNAATRTYTGRSKDVILLEDTFYKITFSDLPTTEASTAIATGYSADFTPPGTLLASDTDNDHLKQFTSSPLPVTLVSFVAAKESKVTVLNWVTTEEVNSDRFEIQHSITGKEWNNIGSVNSHGESKVKNAYTFTDINPAKGENLYRLKMIDKDASFAYSRIQSVTFEGVGADLSIYPNPVVEKMIIRDFAQVTSLTVSDLNGRTVLQSGGTATGEINVKNLTSGMYVVKITRANGVVSAQKILISK